MSSMSTYIDNSYISTSTINNILVSDESAQEREPGYFGQNRNESNVPTDRVSYPPEMVSFGGMGMIVIAILSIIGNLISLMALSRSKKLRRVTTVFIVNLCTSNLLLSFFSLLSSVFIFQSQHWNGGYTYCRFYSIIMYFFTLMSMFTVTTITVNRYVLIVHPKCYPNLFSFRNTALMIWLLWLFPLILTLLPLFKKWGTFGYDLYTGECAIIDHNGSSKIYMFFIAYIVPLVLFFLCYSKIFFEVHKITKNASHSGHHSCLPCSKSILFLLNHESNTNASSTTGVKPLLNQKEYRLLRVILIIFVCYVLCFIPLAIMKILHKEKEFPILYIFIHMGVHLSNLINPIVYVVMNKDYRKAYKELFCGDTGSQ